MPDPSNLLARYRIVPAVVIDDVKTATPLADALVAGGLPVVEVTLRTPQALKALEEMAGRQDILVGAGTVTTLAQFDAARRAGARFIVTPGLDENIIRHANRRDLMVIPGAVTPTEILRAQNMGLNLVKFFPSHAFGGLATIEALSGPFPTMKFMPTGGISLDNLADFLKHPSVFGCGGTWMAKREWLMAGEWKLVTEACRKTVALVKG